MDMNRMMSRALRQMVQLVLRKGAGRLPKAGAVPQGQMAQLRKGMAVLRRLIR